MHHTPYKPTFSSSNILCSPTLYSFNIEFKQKLYKFLTADGFRHIVTVFLFSLPWRWPHGWPKHVAGYYVKNCIHKLNCIGFFLILYISHFCSPLQIFCYRQRQVKHYHPTEIIKYTPRLHGILYVQHDMRFSGIDINVIAYEG